MATPSVRPEQGGPSYTVRSIARYLTDLGCDTVVATDRAGGGEALSSLVRDARFERASVVHNFGIWTPFSIRVSMLSRQTGKPLIICPMGMLEPWALKQKRLKKRVGWEVYQRRNMARAAAIHSTARAEAENLRALGVTTPIAVIRHGIDLPETTDRTEPAARKTVLFLSRIHPKKGLLALVEAWSQLRPPDWRVVIAGPDQEGHRAEVERAVRSKQLDDAFEFAGPVFGDEKAALFRSAHLFVLPTASENFGVVIPEALAYGLPVITTTGAPWTELAETRSGWWIRPDVRALRDALAAAFALPAGELRAMGLRGRDLVEKHYTWPAIARQHLHLYEWLTDPGRERPDFLLE
jgi:glycosyltransferase involved in cell wall biosynthesis